MLLQVCPDRLRCRQHARVRKAWPNVRVLLCHERSSNVKEARAEKSLANDEDAAAGWQLCVCCWHLLGMT